MTFKDRTRMELADMICGNFKAEDSLFPYRSSSALTRFFQEADTEFEHDGSTRNFWVADALRQILDEVNSMPNMPSDSFLRVIKTLMDPSDATNEDSQRKGALEKLNSALRRESYEGFYATDGQCYLKHLVTSTISRAVPNPHRPFTEMEMKRRELLIAYLDDVSEDDLIAHVLVPLFRQLGFHRLTTTGHKDKALEYGKDIWMKFTLPTLHVLYFGIQVKKGKLDAAGLSKPDNTNMAEIHNQALMMLGHEVFDPEIGKRVLVDHALIVAGGEITKSARNWLGNKLDVSKRSQIMFMDRDDLLNLFVVTNLPLPAGAALPLHPLDDGLPF